MNELHKPETADHQSQSRASAPAPLSEPPEDWDFTWQEFLGDPASALAAEAGGATLRLGAASAPDTAPVKMNSHVGAPAREFLPARAAAATQVKVQSGARLVFVDHLRVFLTALVVVHHLAITYGAEGSWFYLERPTTELAGILLSLLTALNQMFFMGLFFLVAGYFVPGSLERKGTRQFLKDRLVRLGIPLVLFTLFISPIDEYIKSVTNGWWSGSFGSFILRYWSSGDPAPGPLWFVELLLVFSLVYALGRAAAGRRSGTRPNAAPLALTTPQPLGHRHILAFILLLAPLNFVVRIFFPIGVEWNHLGVAFFPQYILMFAAGILAYRRGWLTEIPDGVRKVWSGVALLAAASLPVMMMVGMQNDSMEALFGGFTIESLITSTWEGFYCAGISILLLSLFRHRFNRPARLSQILSANAYTVYIIHAPLIVGLALLLRPVALDPLFKFVLAVPLGILLCFLTSHFLVRRIPYADKVL